MSYLELPRRGLGAADPMAPSYVDIFAPWSGVRWLEAKKIQKETRKRVQAETEQEVQRARTEAERQAILIKARRELEAALKAVRAIGDQAVKLGQEAYKAAVALGDDRVAQDARSVIEAVAQIMGSVNSIRTAQAADAQEVDAIRIDLGGAESALLAARDQAQEIRGVAVGALQSREAEAARAAQAREAALVEERRLAAAEEVALRKVAAAERLAAIAAERAQADREFDEIRLLRAQIAAEKKALEQELAALKRMGAA